MTNQTPTILAIDPGYDRLGWAIGTTPNNTLKLIDYGLIKTDSRLSWEDRFASLYQQLTELIDQHQPTDLAIEQLFISKNTTSALKVAEVRGFLIGLAIQHQAHIFQYNPGTIKLSVTGDGKAKKPAVEKMVRMQVKLPDEKIIDDTIDAIAILITHTSSHKLPEVLY